MQCPPAGVSVTPARERALDVDVDDLFMRWQQHGDATARDLLVQRYMPMANKLAHRYRGSHEPLDDLQQIASIGLLKAIDRYDSTRSNGFQAFAVPTIVGELKRYFRDSCWAVHLPRGIQDLAVKVSRAERELAATKGTPPTAADVAEHLELELEDVLDAQQAAAAHYAVSLDAPQHGADGELNSLADSIGELDERFELVDDAGAIRAASAHLTKRERRVLRMRFVEDCTQTQIADEIGVSQMQVSRILRSALNRMSTVIEGQAQPVAR
jgi:RNA polymerase sigma-B factor